MKDFKALRRFYCIFTALFAVLSLTAVPGLPNHAYAATISVTANATDTLNGADGQCSLREALTNINNSATTYADCAPTGAYGTSDTINIPAGTYTTALSGLDDLNATGDYDILKSVIIAGAGSASTTINGGGLDRIFHIIGAVNVSISSVTITNGFSPWVAPWGGGGITNSGGNVTITNSTISGNTANPVGVGNAWGGGIYNASGSLTITNSTVSSNTANGTTGGNGVGGGIGIGGGTVNISKSTINGNTAVYTGGGIAASGGSVNITNTTINSNTALVGGGIYIQNAGTTFTVTNTTVSGNAASTTGGGIYNFSGTVTSSNSIVANQASGADCAGTITSAGNNLESAVSCGFIQVGDLQNSNPLLNALANNGGPTQTMALSVGSPAINAGPATCAAAPVNGLDQRGYLRPSGSACDIGAFEFGATQPQISASPNFFNFGNVNVGSTSTAQTFTITNTGTANLIIGQMAIPALNNYMDFALLNDACSNATVLPTSTCTFQATFTPSAAGARTASINIPSNDTATPTLTIALSGTGIQQYNLTITKSGTGTGTVTSADTFINCGATCSAAYNPGAVITLTATPDANMTFTGWSGGGCTGTGTCTLTMNSALAPNAIFTLNTYTVTPSAGTGGTINPAQAQTVNYNAITSFTVTPNAGYSISSVTGCNGTLSGSTYTTGAITANCTVIATFRANPVNGACGSSSGGTFATAPTANLCTTGTASAVTGTGPWTWTCNGTNGGTNAICSANIHTYTVTASTGAGGTISCNPTTVNSGGSSICTITPDTGFKILYVLVDGTSAGAVASYTFSNVTTNHTISAAFAVNTFTVTSSASTGGTITPLTSIVNIGATTFFTVTPDTGYNIASVTGCNGTLTGDTYTTGPVTADCTVTAVFKDTFAITTPSGPVEVKPGGSLQVSTAGASNVVVDGVSIGAVNIVTFINITGPHTITW